MTKETQNSMPNHPAILAPKPLVSVCCITYNHENFIRDAIEGFLKQTTTFAFEIIIHDDASTDNTTQIIRSYQEKFPSLFTLIIQTENQFSKGVSKVLKNVYGEANGKYIAICEGDDYWTDPLKLQKQVDFLDAHPECSMCCHKVLYEYKNNETANHLFPGIENDRILTRKDISGEFFPKSLSVMFRNIHMDEFISFAKDFWMGDVPLWYFYLQFGSIGYLDQLMGVYRVHENGVWSLQSQLKRHLISYDAYELIRRKLRIRPRDLNLIERSLTVIKDFSQVNDYREMRKYLLKGLIYLPSAKKKQLISYLRYAKRAFLKK